MLAEVKRGRTLRRLSYARFQAKKSGFRRQGPVGTGNTRNVSRFCTTALSARSAFRKIIINTELTGSQCSDYQEASCDTHILKKVLGFMIALHTLD